MPPTELKKILVVDKDLSLLSLIETRLQVRNYEVFVATHSDEAERLTQKMLFDLVVIGTSMERIEGLGLCQRIKQGSANFKVPIILIAEEADLRHLVLSPDRGFDDFLMKPFDALSLQLRVELNLTRARERLQANPLTNLPGTVSVEENIRRRNERHELFSVCYIDINHFKSFNDCYGFERGDAVIRHTGRLILRCLQESQAGRTGFVGHIGGDDFIVVLNSEFEAQFSQLCLQEFDRIIPTYYEEVDRKRRAVLVKNRNGVPCSYPLMSITIASISNQHKPYHTLAEISRDATEVKNYLKTQPGSHYLRDRRAEPLNTLEETIEVVQDRPSEKENETRPLGQILLDVGLVTDDELSNAVRRHVETGERLGQVLIRMNVVTSDALGVCLAEKYGVDYVNVREHELTDELVGLVSEEMMKLHHVIPISVHDNCLSLGMIDPENQKLVEEIEKMSGLRIERKFVLENEFDNFFERRHQGYV